MPPSTSGQTSANMVNNDTDREREMSRDIVLIHGYSDQGKSFRTWSEKLCGDPARDVKTIGIGNYQSLTDEVTIKDLADGLDRALQHRFQNDEQEFDAIVHSTGMLVLREWFVRDRRRLKRLKHLVAIAPATFGSPLARQGRSWLGAVFKGQHHLGPDFLAAGDAILDGLELASPLHLGSGRARRLQRAAVFRRQSGYTLRFCVLRH